MCTFAPSNDDETEVARRKSGKKANEGKTLQLNPQYKTSMHGPPNHFSATFY